MAATTAQGFEASWFDAYYDASGRPHASSLVWDARGRPWLATPRVAALARAHFGCPHLLGAPLEEGGGEGAALTHWDQLLLNHELMATTNAWDAQRPRLSNFTLALLHDTGWYIPNYQHAQPLEWGAGAGCWFVEALGGGVAGCDAYVASRPGQTYLCRRRGAQAAAQAPGAQERHAHQQPRRQQLAEQRQGWQQEQPQQGGQEQQQGGQQRQQGGQEQQQGGQGQDGHRQQPDRQQRQPAAAGAGSAAGSGGLQGAVCSFDARVLARCHQQAAREQPFSGGCALPASPQSVPLSCSSAQLWSRTAAAAMEAVGGVVGDPDSRCFELLGDSLVCTRARQGADGAACSAGGVLCAAAECDSSGRLGVRLTLPGGARALAWCGGDGTVQLAAVLPQHFQSGVLRCPAPGAVCGSLACGGGCKAGVCWRGRCRCFLEATGGDCGSSLLPTPLPAGYYLLRDVRAPGS